MDNTTNINEVSVIINKAVITAIKINFDKDGNKLPGIDVNVALLSSTSKKIADVELSTNSYWNKNTEIAKGDIPPMLYHSVGLILREISPIVIRKINSIDKLLTAEVS